MCDVTVHSQLPMMASILPLYCFIFLFQPMTARGSGRGLAVRIQVRVLRAAGRGFESTMVTGKASDLNSLFVNSTSQRRD